MHRYTGILIIDGADGLLSSLKGAALFPDFTFRDDGKLDVKLNRMVLQDNREAKTLSATFAGKKISIQVAGQVVTDLEYRAKRVGAGYELTGKHSIPEKGIVLEFWGTLIDGEIKGLGFDLKCSNPIYQSIASHVMASGSASLVDSDVVQNPDMPEVSDQDLTLPKTMAVYGNVNKAHNDDFEKVVRILRRNRIGGYILETLSSRSQFPDSGTIDFSQRLDLLYPILVKQAKAFKGSGIWSIWIIFNYNSPYKKFSLAKQKEICDLILKAAAESGNPRIILEVVSEPGSTKNGGALKDKAKQITDYVRSRWSGYLMINGSISGVKYDIADHHVSSIKEIGDRVSGKINATSTDHSITLAQLMVNGKREGEVVDLKDLRSHASKAYSAGFWYILYHWMAEEVDEPACSVLGEIYGGGTSPVQPSNTPDILTTAEWVGRVKGADWAITASISNVKPYRKGGKPFVKYDCRGEENWPTRKGTKTLQSCLCAFKRIGVGKWKGGFVEHCKSNNDEDRPLQNADPGSIVEGVKFNTGDEVIFCVTSLENSSAKQRTQASGIVRWP